jgi:hypothetical protein
VSDLLARASRVARDAPEPLIAITLGVVFTALGLLHAVDGETLSEVSLLVLSALALSVIKDRSSRDTVSEKLEQLDVDVRSLLSKGPYHVLQYTAAVDIRDRGAEAHFTRTKRVRFDQDGVLAVLDYLGATGTSEMVTCTPKPLKRVAEIRDGARTKALISLGRAWNRGEQLEFTVQARVADSFMEDREDLTVDVTEPMDRLVVSLTWPGDREVENVFVERFRKMELVEPSNLTATPDGRPWYVRTFDHPEIGETISVVWDWRDPGPRP